VAVNDAQMPITGRMGRGMAPHHGLGALQQPDAASGSAAGASPTPLLLLLPMLLLAATPGSPAPASCSLGGHTAPITRAPVMPLLAAQAVAPAAQAVAGGGPAARPRDTAVFGADRVPGEQLVVCEARRQSPLHSLLVAVPLLPSLPAACCCLLLVLTHTHPYTSTRSHPPTPTHTGHAH
jgi:hypothetical protein